MRDTPRKRLDQSISKMARAFAIPEATVVEYLELDLNRIRNDNATLNEARLLIVEERCEKLSATVRELTELAGSKQALLRQLSARVDSARSQIADREKEIALRRNELEELKDQLSGLNEQLDTMKQAQAQARYDLLQSRRAAAPQTSLKQFSAHTLLTLFTLIGIVIAVYLIISRTH